MSNVERIAETARLLEDKVAIIAGSGRGIGLTAALLLIGAALDHFGRLDIIVNNAGYTHDGLIHEISDEQWHAMPECHPTAPFRILRAASACWREIAKQEAQNGRPQVREVVNVSPASGGADNAGQINYAGVA